MNKKKKMVIAASISSFLMINNITVYANVEMSNNVNESALVSNDIEENTAGFDMLTGTEIKEDVMIETELSQENDKEVNKTEDSTTDVGSDEENKDDIIDSEEKEDTKDESTVEKEEDNSKDETTEEKEESENSVEKEEDKEISPDVDTTVKDEEQNKNEEVNTDEVTTDEVSEPETQSEDISTYGITYEREPNNSTNGANLVGVNNNTYYNGYISSNEDVDYFKVSLQSNSELSISFENTSNMGTWYVQIINEKNQVVDEARFGGKYSNSFSYRKVGVSKGNYYIKVSDGSVGETYSFNLTAKNISTELELNNSTATATTLKLGSTTSGTLQHHQDMDYFKIVLPKNGVLNLDLTFNEYNVGYEFYSAGGTVYNNIKDLGLRAGTYYLLIKPTSGFYDLPGEYKWHHYTINSNFTAHSTYEIESNNTKETATQMLLNKKYYGNLQGYSGSDEDYFKINVSNSTKGKLLVSKGSQKFSLRITDSYGNIYVDLNNISGNYYSPANINLPRGNYYVHIRNGEGNYNLEFREAGDWRAHWANNEIRNAMQKKWVNTSDTFRPNEAITRAEFIKIVNKAFGFTKKASKEPFNDVASNNWWYNEVLIAIGNGYISTSNSNFRPRDPITREEVANIITTITKTKDSNLDKLNKYKDKHLVSNSAKSSVEGAIEQKFMGVNSTMFNPKKNITRAEAIVSLTRVAERK